MFSNTKPSRNLAKMLLVAVLFSSCGKEGNFPTTPTKWKIERIKSNKNGMSIYLVEPLEKKDLNMSNTWFVDSIGKYNTGDILSFHAE